MREERGQIAGDLIVNEPFELWGNVGGSVTVGEGGKFYVRGSILGDLIVQYGGRVHIYGQVHGNVIGIDHGQGVEGIFLHLSSIKVKPGEFVQAGQVVGALGDTGAATGPHLHWGLYVNGQSVDPVPWREDGFE